ncbi:MAG TPA: WYL domain-containing protein [Tepidisphaeraceae bacterium]|jgi:proteasome accessory factor B|nr:WYL domain-containing protein [Tepidisphaeraceae bacterium]
MDYTSHVYRLFRLIVQIQGNPNLNAKRLAEIHGVHERTIYRDIDILQGATVPVSFDEDTGGYTIRRDFFLRPIDLALDEAMALLLLANHVAANEQIPHLAQAARGAEKIRAVLPRQFGEWINELIPRLTISLARSANEPTADVHEKMRQAIATRRALQCQYESPNRRSPDNDDAAIFRFDPYALYFGQRAWYVVGHHHAHNEIRTLKLCRFTRCHPTDKPYFIPDDFSLATHFGKAWRMMPTGTLHDIALHFDPTCAETVADTHWHDSQTVTWLPDGSVNMTFRVDGLEEIIWWIASYGPHCRVMNPPELATRIQHLHATAAGQYGKPT